MKVEKILIKNSKNFATLFGKYIENKGAKLINFKDGGYNTYSYKNSLITIPIFFRKVHCIFIKFEIPQEKIKQHPLFNSETNEINYLTRFRNRIKVIEDFDNWIENLVDDR